MAVGNRIYLKILKNRKIPVDIFPEISYNHLRCSEQEIAGSKCRSGGIGRRARFRSVW